MTPRYDVVIVGAGPGGATAAHYLAQAGCDVLLLDKFDFPRDKTCGDGLTPRALAVLDDLDLLNTLRHAGCPVSGLDIVAPNGCATTAALPRTASAPDSGLVVPRLLLDNAIRERALTSGARFQSPVRVTNIAPGPQEVVVTGEQRGRSVSLRARLAIIATGASPSLLLRLGILRKPPPLMLAARAYFEGVTGLTGRLQFRFDGVPLPGYGWVFPLSDTSANIGAGFFPVGRAAHRLPASPHTAFEAFIRTPPLQALLHRARRVGPVKGYPLRVDFLTAPTFAERVLLVGEAAGLVNPLTGEGIDYALESGQLAAEQAVRLLAADDWSYPSLAMYDQLLRQRFEPLFRLCTRMRDWFLKPWVLNRLVDWANRRPDLTMRLVHTVLSSHEAVGDMSLRRLVQLVFAANW